AIFRMLRTPLRLSPLSLSKAFLQLPIWLSRCSRLPKGTWWNVWTVLPSRTLKMIVTSVSIPADGPLIVPGKCEDVALVLHDPAIDDHCAECTADTEIDCHGGTCEIFPTQSGLHVLHARRAQTRPCRAVSPQQLAPAPILRHPCCTAGASQSLVALADRSAPLPRFRSPTAFARPPRPEYACVGVARHV